MTQQLSKPNKNFLELYLKEHDLNKTTKIDLRLVPGEQILDLLNQSRIEDEKIDNKIAKLSDSEKEELKSFLNVKIAKYEKWEEFETKILLPLLYTLGFILLLGAMSLGDKNVFVLIDLTILLLGMLVYLYIFLSINKYYYNYKFLQKQYLVESINE